MSKRSDKFQRRLDNLPDTPGVYLMRNDEDEVIYVGKARVLKNRVRQYFTAEPQLAKVAAMITRIHDFEYIITDTELEALVLESNLIKQYRPYYNVLLKDDKHFPYLRIDTNEPFPRVEVVRSVEDDGAKYYGPFIAAHVIRDVLDDIYKLYPLRSCKKDIYRAIERKERPCLNYEMGRCVAPCTGNVSEEEYGELVKEVMSIISGDGRELKRELKRQMQEASDELNYELAAKLRDKIGLVDRIKERQKAGFPNLDDKDIFALYTGSSHAVVQAFLFRDGKLNYARKYHMDYEQENRAEVMENFLQQYYLDKSGVPKRIFVDPLPADVDLLMEWLSDVRGNKVTITQAQRGDNRKLQDLAKKNAKDSVTLKESSAKQKLLALNNLAEELGLDGELRRIECYDISNLQGTDSVAAMAVYINGQPDKSQYRRFRIKTVEGADDYASQQEVLTRRLIRGLQEDAGFADMPDLIIMDGGKGQLSAGVDALASVGCEHIPIISLAEREEEIFLPYHAESVLLRVGSPEYRLVTGIRDEAHRFAVTYHRKVREKRIHRSELDGITGVGDVRKRDLLRHFGSLKKVKQASLAELKEVQGLPENVAENIYHTFHKKSS